MEYVPLTPFRRAIDAAQSKIVAHQGATLPQPVNKWAALRELSAARGNYGLSDRDLIVLQALLSFHPGDELSDPRKLVLHPSNATICARLHDMPCSTMRRHLANLVRAGIIQRRDSPNGKRYVRRGPLGTHSFGFDLTPLVIAFSDIAAAADRARKAEAHRLQLRERVSLMRRDLAQLTELAASAGVDFSSDALRDLATLTARALRRKLDLGELQRLEKVLSAAIQTLQNLFSAAQPPAETVKMSTSDAENEQHYQRSKKEYLESESAQKVPAESIPLGLVLTACPEILSYADHPIRHWIDFTRLAERIRPMLGIGDQVWYQARSAMGLEDASITIATMLQRFQAIRSPGAYLRSLAGKAAEHAYSARPMLLALIRSAESSQL